MPTLIIVQYASAFFALVAALLWLWSAAMKLPRATLALWQDGKRVPPPLETAMKMQSARSAWAAVAAAVSAVLQGVTTLLSMPLA